MLTASSLPWVEKYRPSRIEGILGHQDITRTLQAFVDKGQIPHILLHGPPGTGKTSVVKALVLEVCSYQREYRVLELNASDERGIQTVRERIKFFVDASIVAGCAVPAGETPTAATAETPTAAPKPAVPKTPAPKTPAQKPSSAAPKPAAGSKSAAASKQAPRQSQTNLRSFFPVPNGGAPKAPATKPEPAPKAAPPEPAPKPPVPAPKATAPAPAPKPRLMPTGPPPGIHAALENIKFVILDEVDQMTTVAQTALRRVMEKHADRVRFLLMCNDVNKINLPIQSRCCKFHFAPIDAEFMREKLRAVIAAEDVQISEDAVAELVTLSQGDFRKLLNTLQACALSTKQTVRKQPTVDEMTDASTPTDAVALISVDVVRRSLGLPDRAQVAQLLHTLQTEPFAARVRLLKRLLIQEGFALADLVDACYTHLLPSLSNAAALSLLPRLAHVKSARARGARALVQAGCLAAAFTELR